MKLGIFTALFQDRPLGQVLRRAAELGYEMVELPCFRGNPHLDLHAVIEDRGRSLLRLVRSFGLEISALANARESQLVLGPHDWTMDKWAPVQGVEERIQYAVERLKRTAQAAAMVGAPLVNGFSGSPGWDKWYNFPSTNDGAYERSWQLFAERFNPILDAFKEYGVRYAIDPVVFIKRLGKRIYHAHAKDGEVQADEVARTGVLSGGPWTRPDRGFRFRVPGWGNVDWRRVISALTAVGYDYVLSFEHEDRVMSPEDGAEKAIALPPPPGRQETPPECVVVAAGKSRRGTASQIDNQMLPI